MRFLMEKNGVRFEFEGDVKDYTAHFSSIVSDLLSAEHDVRLSITNSEKLSTDLVTDTNNIAPNMTAKAVASINKPVSGSTLLYSSVAWLAVIQKKDSFTRQEILNAMKAAVGYFKPSYSGNLTKYLDAAQKNGLLIETSSNVFSVKADELEKMKHKILSSTQ